MEDIAKIIRDYHATHASFRLEANGYGLDMNLIARALEQLGDPIARKDVLILYRLHPDVWLGREFLTQAPLTAQQSAWQVAGKVTWVDPEGAILGEGASLQQSPASVLKRDYLYRLTVEMNCTRQGQNLHIAVIYNRPGLDQRGRFDDFPPCGVVGKVTRDFYFTAPSYNSPPTVIIDNAQAALLRATLREGYATR